MFVEPSPLGGWAARAVAAPEPARPSSSSGPTARERLASSPWAQGALVTLALVWVYFLVGSTSSPFDQYTRLADAFLHGHLHLTGAPDNLELARYDTAGRPCTGAAVSCHGFVIDPPAPAVLLMPFVLIFGPGVNGALLASYFGAAAMGLFWVAVCRLGWGLGQRVGITVLLALGTDFWWAATDGSLWTFSQVAAVFFMMAAFAEATGRGRPWLVGLLVGLAGLSRLPTFLAFPFFLYLVLRDDLAAAPRLRTVVRSPRVVVGKVVMFASALGTMAVADLAYNWARYGTIADRGFAHPQYAAEPFFDHGRFSPTYVPRQVEAILFAPPRLTEGHFPWFEPSLFGTALFMVTPAFLYVFLAGRGRLEAAAAISLALVMVPALCHGTTGWTQFGYRYSLDWLPMLAVLTASGMSRRRERRHLLVIGLSVLLAVWGPLFFFDTRLEDLIGVSWRLSP